MGLVSGAWPGPSLCVVSVRRASLGLGICGLALPWSLRQHEWYLSLGFALVSAFCLCGLGGEEAHAPNPTTLSDSRLDGLGVKP